MQLFKSPLSTIQDFSNVVISKSDFSTYLKQKQASDQTQLKFDDRNNQKQFKFKRNQDSLVQQRLQIKGNSLIKSLKDKENKETQIQIQLNKHHLNIKCNKIVMKHQNKFFLSNKKYQEDQIFSKQGPLHNKIIAQKSNFTHIRPKKVDAQKCKNLEIFLIKNDEERLKNKRKHQDIASNIDSITQVTDQISEKFQNSSQAKRQKVQDQSQSSKLFVPNWIQSIQSSISNKICEIHKGLGFYTGQNKKELHEDQKVLQKINQDLIQQNRKNGIQRTTLDPLIPENMKLEQNFNQVQKIQNHLSKLDYHQTQFGFCSSSDQYEQENYKIEEENLTNIDFLSFSQQLQEQSFERQVVHQNCDDFIELNLQSNQISYEDNENQNLYFPLYKDSSLQFLDIDTEIGRRIQKSIVQADFDDDVATDDEMQDNARKNLQRELQKGIDKFIQLQKQGTANKMVKNLQLLNRFQNTNFFIESDEEEF